MHISEGILSPPVLVAGAVVAAAGIAVGLRKMDDDKVPQVALLASAFFVASLVHVPIGPSNVHLVLSGLVGLLLGWAAIPAITVGLTLQAVLFQFGGITTLGVNTVIMGMPAIICFYLFNRLCANGSNFLALSAAFLCGFISIVAGSLLIALFLVWTGESFKEIAAGVVLAHLPVMVIEGFLTMFLVGFLRKVRPEILEIAYAKK